MAAAGFSLRKQGRFAAPLRGKYLLFYGCRGSLLCLPNIGDAQAKACDYHCSLAGYKKGITISRIYVYSIIDDARELNEPVKGIKGSSVYNIPYRALGIVVSDIAGERLQATERRVLEHERVNEKLMERRTVLPCRFNTLFEDKEKLLFAVGERYADLQTNLNRLQGSREYGLKVIWPGKAMREKIEENYTKQHLDSNVKSPPAPLFQRGGREAGAESLLYPPLKKGGRGDFSGKRFMQRLYKRYKIDEEFSAEAAGQIEYIDGFFTDCVVTKKLEKLRTENLLLSAYYLVKREKEEELKAAFTQLRSQAKGFKCLLSGPWPPYNFIQNAGLLGQQVLWNGKING